MGISFFLGSFSPPHTLSHSGASEGGRELFATKKESGDGMRESRVSELEEGMPGLPVESSLLFPSLILLCLP